MQPRVIASKEATPLYAESINMLEGLPDDEVDRYLEEHPRIVPLFEVDIMAAIEPYITTPGPDEPDQAAIRELRQAQESLEKEMTISQRGKSIPTGGGGPGHNRQAPNGKRCKRVTERREEGNGGIINGLQGRIRMVI